MQEGRCPDAWAELTVKEADVLTAVLGAGAAVARAAAGSHELVMDTYAVIRDVDEARRQRWNSENPGYQYEFEAG
jgi:hypothetical protein